MAGREHLSPSQRLSTTLLGVARAFLVFSVFLGYGFRTIVGEKVTAEQKLVAAIEKCSRSSTETVLHTITENIVLSKPLPHIHGKIVIKGSCGGGGRKCVVDGAGKFGIFVSYVAPCAMEMENLILQNASGEGAVNAKCALKLKGVDFKNNKNGVGGAVVVREGTATWHIEDCLFEKNEAADSAGALYVASDGRGRVVRTTFRSNSAKGTGGAVYVFAIADQPAFDRVVFDANRAGSDGGAMAYSPRGLPARALPVFIHRCNFTRNVAAGRGGALALRVLLDARICHPFFSNNDGVQGKDLALLDNNFGQGGSAAQRMTVAFCPGRPKALSLFITPPVTNAGGSSEPIIRDHCHGCGPPN